ncbi:MAG: hypothetical protein L3J23_02670 [Flavobacteriaceae bacterium]|nr:hypothetical protein [Flavobacteriaceae bacterium]
MSNVLIKEIFENPQSTTSDKKGYFKLNKSPNVISDLIFLKKGYIEDTISTVWSQYGETQRNTFYEQNF